MNNTLGIYEKAIPLKYSWDQKFEIAYKYGFDYIEISIDGKERLNRIYWEKKTLDEILNACKKYHMSLITMAVSANRFFPLGDLNYASKGKEILIKSIDIASYLGVKIIQFGGYDVLTTAKSTKESLCLFEKNLREILNYTQEKNIIMAMEVLEDIPRFNTIKQCVEYIDKINHPNFKIYADFGNVVYNGYDVVDDLKYDKGQIVACHAKDGILHNERNIKYGQGLVDFDKCFQHFKDTNYQNSFVSECWCEEDENFLPYLKEINDYLRSKMK